MRWSPSARSLANDPFSSPMRGLFGVAEGLGFGFGLFLLFAAVTPLFACGFLVAATFGLPLVVVVVVLLVVVVVRAGPVALVGFFVLVVVVVVDVVVVFGLEPTVGFFVPTGRG